MCVDMFSVGKLFFGQASHYKNLRFVFHWTKRLNHGGESLLLLGLAWNS